MNEILGTQSEELIASVYLMKSQLIQQYEYFAKQAKKDGYEQIAAIFQETAEQLRSHTKTLIRLIEGSTSDAGITLNIPAIGNTGENLKTATDQERKCISLMQQAESMTWGEGFKRASTKLKLFIQISGFYLHRFSAILEKVDNGTVFKRPGKVKWICRKCGLIYENDRALHNCPGCEHPQAYFEVLAENW